MIGLADIKGIYAISFYGTVLLELLAFNLQNIMSVIQLHF
jgi:hypothetical protein